MTISVSPGFFLLWALLIFFDGEGVAPWAVLACGLHEVAHVLAFRAAGGRISLLRLTMFGAELAGEDRAGLSYGGELLAVLAGPGINLLLAMVGARGGERYYLFAGLNLCLGLFNLLPLPGLDGGRAIGILFHMLSGEKRGKKRKKNLH